jgi:hypothetical protein
MSPLRRAATAIQLDSALAAALGFRVWQGLSGVVTIVLVGRLFSLDLQGCYYTFMSVLALQTLSDLGLFIVVINVASHEWARLGFGPDGAMSGDDAARARLVSLGRQMGGWYAAIGCLSGLAVALGGWWFFGRTVPSPIEWRGPWLALVALATLSFCASPFVALLEGCNQVAVVNRYRLVGAMVGSLGMWIAMAGGFGLWALVVMVACQAARDVLLLTGRYGRFFRSFAVSSAGAHIGWWTEIWPMQWRLGLQGASQYVSSQVYNPMLMYYHGAAAAGRFGMTWVAVSGIQAVALAWIQTRVPMLGQLAARGDRSAFTRLWLRSSLMALGAVVGGGAALCGILLLLDRAGSPLAGRMLPAGLTAVLVVGAVCAQVVQILAAYLRAHKREVLTPVGVGSSVVAGGLGWILSRWVGMAGAAAAYALAMGAVAMPAAILIWWQTIHRGAKEPRGTQLWPTEPR